MSSSTARTPSSAASKVIDWDEAMEQCGDDEDFLRELLGDLRAETDAQMDKIEQVLMENSTPLPPDEMQKIMRASHVIKGAASNLMCGELRLAAMQLEQQASTNNSSSSSGGASKSAATSNGELGAAHEELKRAVGAYHSFLQSIGI